MNFQAYHGRTFDLLALRGAQPVRNVRLDQTLFGTDSGGDVCTGIQKLAQRWVLGFLTIRGTMKFLPALGTDFLREGRRGQFRTEADIVAAFGFAMVPLGKQLRNEERADQPNDERYGGAELLRVTLTGDSMSLTVRISSLAGTSREVILPISVVPSVLQL